MLHSQNPFLSMEKCFPTLEACAEGNALPCMLLSFIFFYIVEFGSVISFNLSFGF